ncbi:hypothetical protein M413DRAFT_122068 [Hebeloma cylindrosporum]|uniref:Uncharacterized protein n=1 Tax=Hebeloma cylindrosporum TaxID=76867 RepID=A0A0C2YNV7_HEBCY|nr:hypothetical protein M413DRAFT_122068 [Hebeloma cylindrosporum h7]
MERYLHLHGDSHSEWRSSSPSVLSNSVSLGKDASSSSTYISSSELPLSGCVAPLLWRGGCSATAVGSRGDVGEAGASRTVNLRSARPSTQVISIGTDTVVLAVAHSVQIAMKVWRCSESFFRREV